MSQTEWGNYYEDEQVQALELDYANNELSMVFILPQEGEFADFETSMTVDDLDAIIDNLTSANGRFRSPASPLSQAISSSNHSPRWA